MAGSVTDSRDCHVYIPTAQTTSFSVPAPDAFDTIFLEAGLNSSPDSQDSISQIDFLFSLMENKPATPGFGGSVNVDIPAWNEAVFGESPSQESTSSSSSWELTAGEGPSAEMGVGTNVDMDLQFPSISVDAIGSGTDMPTEDEFLRAMMGVVQSSPKAVGPISYTIVPSVCALIQLIRFNYVRFFGGNQSPAQDWFESFCDMGVFDL